MGAEFDKLLPVLSLIIGWALNEVSSILRPRREDRRAAGPVLADLFEIRHRLVALDAFRKELGKELQIPAQPQLQLENYILALVPAPPNFAERYEQDVSTLARVDPILAFRLRSQPLIGPVLEHLRALATSDQGGSELWSAVVEPKLLEQLKPRLEELILDLARAHGWRTWWRARRRLSEPVLTQDDQKVISNLLTEIKKASRGPTGL